MDIKYDSWDKISINRYYDIVDIMEDDSLSEVDKELCAAAVLCDVSEDEVFGLTVPEARELLRKTKFLRDFSFRKEIRFKSLNLNGKKYSVMVDMSDMNVSQYVDFQLYWSKNDLRKYYGNVLACFIIPEGKKYNEGYDVMELAEELRDLISIKMANEICFFFLKEWVSSIKASEMYSEWMMKKMMRKEKNPAIKMKLGRLIILNREKNRLTLGSLQLTPSLKQSGNLGL